MAAPMVSGAVTQTAAGAIVEVMTGCAVRSNRGMLQ